MLRGRTLFQNVCAGENNPLARSTGVRWMCHHDECGDVKTFDTNIRPNFENKWFVTRRKKVFSNGKKRLNVCDKSRARRGGGSIPYIFESVAKGAITTMAEQKHVLYAHM